MESKLISMMEQPIPSKIEYRQLNYRPTIHKLNKTYDILNHVLFDNELEKCHLNVRGIRQAWGCAYPLKRNGVHKTYIEVLDKLPCEQFMVAVLAHEMVHQWQWDIVEPKRKLKKYLADHGKAFYSWKSKFENYGINFGTYIPHYV